MTDATATALARHAWANLTLPDVAASHVAALMEVARADRDGDEIVTRHNPDGDSSAPLAVRVAQIAHHGTEHRSQVCTILTSWGSSRRRSTSGRGPTSVTC